MELYQRLYDIGARGALIRFETCNEKLYAQYKPGSSLDQRLNLIRKLREMGYLIITGFLVGLPGQKSRDIIKESTITGRTLLMMFTDTVDLFVVSTRLFLS